MPNPYSQTTLEQTLLYAVHQGEIETMKSLLKEHEFLKVKQHEDNSPFHTCLRNHARELVKVFVTEDASLAAKINYTKAHQFADEGNLPELKVLLEAQPALLHATDSYGNTPLHLAATQGHLETIQYLHQAGANLTQLNADQNSPLQLALLFDKHSEKNAVKYIINENCLIQELDINIGLNIDQSNTRENPKVNNELKSITQDAWQQLISENYQYHYGDNPAQNKIKIANILLEKGYLPALKDINVGIEFMTNNIDFSGVSFDHCVFGGTFSQVKFSEGTIVNSEFDHAYFNHAEFGDFTNFMNTSFSDTYFHNSIFNQNEFHHTVIAHSSFENTTVTASIFDNAFISHSNLLGLAISAPQLIQVILDNTAIKPEAVQAFSNEIQFLNTNAPVIGLISGPYEIIYGGEVGMTGAAPYARIKQYGATPVSLNMESIHEQINQSALIKEIKTILTSVPEGINIPKYLLSQHAENLDKIKLIAQDYAEHLDAAWIPGGPDVHPEFYGQENTGSWNSDYSYVREIFEFALIDQMVTHDKPLMGVCHGSQITNVYFGGTLIQNVEGHGSHHLIMPLGNTDGVVSQVLTAPAFGVSAHHQAIDKIGEGLQVVAVSGAVIQDFIVDINLSIPEVIEASEGTNGKPVMLFQFHPEYNIDDTNRDILMKFVDLAKQYHQTHAEIETTSLQLSDMLISNHADINITPAAPTPVYIPELGQTLLLTHTDIIQL